MIRFTGVAAAILAVALVLTLGVPVSEWRTGDQGLASMQGFPEAATPPFSRRVWIDTDAACGHGPRTDPDDCFAIALLVRAPEIELVGISTVAGNAPHPVVEATARQLAGTVPVHSGPQALQAALEQGPLTVLALGPLTNIAAVLGERPQLAGRVSRLIAVMGRRPGHIFHPAEGAPAGSFLGHGPVFRDFNFALDPPAAARMLAMNLPLTLVPYDAARGVEITAEDLDRLAAWIPWIVERARGWLEYWRTAIGRQGFYPFDLLAAAYIVEPSWLRCTRVHAWVGDDDTLPVPWTAQALLVDPRKEGAVLYCGAARPATKHELLKRFAPGS